MYDLRTSALQQSIVLGTLAKLGILAKSATYFGTARNNDPFVLKYWNI